MTDERCEKCQYSSILTGLGDRVLSCIYCTIEYKPRGCKAGAGCTKFVEGPRLERKVRP